MTDTKTEVPDVLAMMNAALADIHTEHPDTIPCPAPLDAMSEEELVLECWRVVKRTGEAVPWQDPDMHIYRLGDGPARGTWRAAMRDTAALHLGGGPTPRDALLDVLRQVDR